MSKFLVLYISYGGTFKMTSPGHTHHMEPGRLSVLYTVMGIEYNCMHDNGLPFQLCWRGAGTWSILSVCKMVKINEQSDFDKYTFRRDRTESKTAIRDRNYTPITKR